MKWRRCPNCKVKPRADAKFCNQCGVCFKKVERTKFWDCWEMLIYGTLIPLPPLITPGFWWWGAYLSSLDESRGGVIFCLIVGVILQIVWIGFAISHHYDVLRKNISNGMYHSKEVRLQHKKEAEEEIYKEKVIESLSKRKRKLHPMSKLHPANQ